MCGDLTNALFFFKPHTEYFWRDVLPAQQHAAPDLPSFLHADADIQALGPGRWTCWQSRTAKLSRNSSYAGFCQEKGTQPEPQIKPPPHVCSASRSFPSCRDPGLVPILHIYLWKNLSFLPSPPLLEHWYVFRLAVSQPGTHLHRETVGCIFGETFEFFFF